MADWLSQLLKTFKGRDPYSEEELGHFYPTLQQDYDPLEGRRVGPKAPRTMDIPLLPEGAPKPATMRAKTGKDTIREIVRGDYLADKAEDVIGKGPIPEAIRLATPDVTDLGGGPVMGGLRPVAEMVDRGIFKSRLMEKLGDQLGKSKPTPVAEVQRSLLQVKPEELEIGGLTEFMKGTKKGTAWPEELAETADKRLPMFNLFDEFGYEDIGYPTGSASVPHNTLLMAQPHGTPKREPARGASKHFQVMNPDAFVRWQTHATDVSDKPTLAMLEAQSDIDFSKPNIHRAPMPLDWGKRHKLEGALEREHRAVVHDLRDGDRYGGISPYRYILQQFEGVNPDYLGGRSVKELDDYFSGPLPQYFRNDNVLALLEDIIPPDKFPFIQELVRSTRNATPAMRRWNNLTERLQDIETTKRDLFDLAGSQHSGTLSKSSYPQMLIKSILQRSTRLPSAKQFTITPGRIINEALGNTTKVQEIPYAFYVKQTGKTYHPSSYEHGYFNFDQSSIPDDVIKRQLDNVLDFDTIADAQAFTPNPEDIKDVIETDGGLGNPTWYDQRYPDLLRKILKEYNIPAVKGTPAVFQSRLDDSIHTADTVDLDPIKKFLRENKFYAW